MTGTKDYKPCPYVRGIAANRITCSYPQDLEFCKDCKWYKPTEELEKKNGSLEINCIDDNDRFSSQIWKTGEYTPTLKLESMKVEQLKSISPNDAYYTNHCDIHLNSQSGAILTKIGRNCVVSCISDKNNFCHGLLIVNLLTGERVKVSFEE